MGEISPPVEGYWINNWIGRRAELTPNWLALVDEVNGGRYLTYADFNSRVDKVARFLKEELGIQKGDRVAMLSWNRVEILDCLFACGKIGAIFAPVNVRLTAREIADYFKAITPRVLVYEPVFSEKVKELLELVEVEHTITLDTGGLEGSIEYSEALSSQPLERPERVGLEDPWMILQTGGTTGKPKAGIVPFRMVLWNIVNTVRDLIVPGDTTITALPLFHIGGYTYTIPLLFWGGTNILLYRWNVERYIELVERERPTFLFLVPTQLKMLVEHPRFKDADFTSVRWFTSGGAAQTEEIRKAFDEKGLTLKQGYGLTEMGPGVFALDPWDARRKAGSIGKPNYLVDVRVVDEEGRDVGPNEDGELLLRGPSVFGGYWQMPDETAKAFEGGWLHTGDLVRYDEEGYFYIVGRKKFVIRSGAESIYPWEVEEIIKAHPKVADVLVIGVPDEKWGEVPKALVVVKEGETLTGEEIVRFCEGKLARYKIPRYIQFVEEIPRSPVGKVLWSEVRARYGQPGGDYVRK